jgi:hypothetical protein
MRPQPPDSSQLLGPSLRVACTERTKLLASSLRLGPIHMSMRSVQSCTGTRSGPDWIKQMWIFISW